MSTVANVAQISEVAPLLIGFGYGRDASAQQGDIWYSHPAGHQIHAVQMPEGIGSFWWEYFPPELVGERTRGHGLQKLESHLQAVHAAPDKFQPAWQDGVTESSPMATRTVDSADRDYLIVQTLVAPVERYEVRESGSEYPRLIGHDPKTGEWRDFNADADQDRGDQRYIEVVRRWIQLGRPALKRDATLASKSGWDRGGGSSAGTKEYGGYELGSLNGTLTPNTSV